MTRHLTLLALLLLASSAFAQPGLVASWTFDEGQGDTIADASGQGNHGKLNGGPTFVKRGDGYALSFDGKDDWVDCGTGASLDLTRALTLEAWVKPEALPGAEPMILGKYYDSYGLTLYRDGNFWFYISGGGNNAKGRSEAGVWTHVVATFDGGDMAVYVNHQLADRHKSKAAAIAHGGNFLMGLLRAAPSATDPGYGPTSFWRGLLDEVRVYDRALTQEEVIAHYKASAGGFGVDTAWFDRARVTLYPSRTEPKLVAVVDVSGVFLRPSGSRIELALQRTGTTEPLLQKATSDVPRSGRWCATIDLPSMAPGDYTVTAKLTTPDGQTFDGAAAMKYPLPPLVIPAPSQQPPMPTVRDTVLPYKVQVQPGGGFTVTAGGATWPLASSFSYPDSGDNRLAAGPRDTQGEKDWQVTTRQVAPGRWEVTARGRHYSLRRVIRTERSRVIVTDTLKNESAEDVGISFRHSLDVARTPWDRCWVAGYPMEGERDQCYSATAFAAWSRNGVGVVPLDDLSVIQGHVFAQNGQLGFRNERFGLPPGDSHTFEWAVYPTASADYYDFLNQVRRDEGRNRVTVQGGFGFVSQTSPISREYAEMRNLAYGSFGCLCNVADDPEIEIEGLDFLWLPKERARLKQQFDAIRALNPQLKLMFHIAHTLLTTNKPSELFPDSRVIGADGAHLIWPYDYMNTGYFTRRRAEEGYRWYAYYPTPGNTFHDALMKSVDVLVDDIGGTGAFMDGFFCGYVSPWTYDRWDNRTVQLDPQTRRITRKYGSVLWMSQPSMVEFTKRMTARNAVVVANNVIITRTIGALPLVTDQECRSGPDVHLAQTPCALGDPTNLRGDADVYQDVLDKLRWGVLYFYYGEGTLTYPSLPQQQYPITVESIHAGTVRGKERVVTMHSGAYGWPGNRDLHFGYRYNNIGAPIPAEFITSVDRSGVRTQVQLDRKESAVIKRLPVELQCASPVNLLVSRYDSEALTLQAHGKGRATLIVRDGDFAVAAGQEYMVSVNNIERKVKANQAGALRVPLTLNGPTSISIRKH
jgi:hypothetical protein